MALFLPPKVQSLPIKNARKFISWPRTCSKYPISKLTSVPSFCIDLDFRIENSCCGAGTAADTEMTTNLIASQLELLRLNTGREVHVRTANTLLKRMLVRYQRHVSAALVLGGVDNTGPHIYSIHPHGSTDKLPYTTMGSDSLAAMSVFESPSIDRF